MTNTERTFSNNQTKKNTNSGGAVRTMQTAGGAIGNRTAYSFFSITQKHPHYHDHHRYDNVFPPHVDLCPAFLYCDVLLFPRGPMCGGCVVIVLRVVRGSCALSVVNSQHPHHQCVVLAACPLVSSPVSRSFVRTRIVFY